MKRFTSVLLPFLLTSALVAASPAVFIVRHGEKASGGGNDPELSAAGQKRAEALAQILKDAEITAIFVSEFKRTQETALPTSKESHIELTKVPGGDVAALAAKLRALNGNALVVGHGNTIPDLIKALGFTASINIPEADYSEIFIVRLGEQPELVHLHYPF